MSFSSIRSWLFPAALLITLIVVWQYFRPDPRATFLSEVEEMITLANKGDHLDLRSRLSPQAEDTISAQFLSVPQALVMARQMDKNRATRYRMAQLTVFYPQDYAEVEIDRSGADGDFSQAHRFPVPFFYQQGKWLVAGGFRGERDFSNPFTESFP
jgi:hypothetical protein